MAEFQHGLFGCFDNIGLCLVSYFVPCYQFGKNAEAVGEGCFLCGLASMVPLVNFYAVMKIRGKIREAKGIEGSAVSDLLTWCFCGICALVQEAQEVQGMTPQSIARE
ncbi:cornifelin homolog A-like [Ylistrum balloti]|uniref:cornifelin homolog A-like n=1 Tax=Ylistrum balloti TaxID=509963 RepID=UPI002905C3B8|nr:cornifelin homolog A-like [Ylistrum balloti]